MTRLGGFVHGCEWSTSPVVGRVRAGGEWRDRVIARRGLAGPRFGRVTVGRAGGAGGPGVGAALAARGGGGRSMGGSGSFGVRWVSVGVGLAVVAALLVAVPAAAVTATAPPLPAPLAPLASAAEAAHVPSTPKGVFTREPAKGSPTQGQLVSAAAVKTAAGVAPVGPVVAQGARYDVVDNGDGTLTATLAAAPVNYRDAGGAWHKIDNSIVAAGDGSFQRGGAGDVLVPGWGRGGCVGVVGGLERRAVAGGRGGVGAVGVGQHDHLPERVPRGRCRLRGARRPGEGLGGAEPAGEVAALVVFVLVGGHGRVGGR